MDETLPFFALQLRFSPRGKRGLFGAEPPPAHACTLCSCWKRKRFSSRMLCLSIKRFCLKNKRFIPDNEEIQGKTSHCRMIGCEFSPESSPFGAQLPQRAQGPAGGQEAAWAG